MPLNNSKIKKIIEQYLNEINLSDVEVFYGSGSKIKIHTITYSLSQKSILVEAVIVLGGVIIEETLDRAPAELMIQNCIPYLFPEISSVKVMTRWDV
jgi:hypothetical protein